MNYVSFYGGESTGSVGKKNEPQIRNITPRRFQEDEGDKVCFRGYEYEEKSPSFLSRLFKLTAVTALLIGGLGYAHKADVLGKMKDGKVKDFLKKSDIVTEQCHKLCSKTKQCFVGILDKAKSIFSKGK